MVKLQIIVIGICTHFTYGALRLKLKCPLKYKIGSAVRTLYVPALQARPIFGKHSALPLLGESDVWPMAGRLVGRTSQGLGPKWQCRAALAISAYIMFPLQEHCVGGEKARAFGLAQLLADRCRSRLVCMMGPLFSTEKMI